MSYKLLAPLFALALAACAGGNSSADIAPTAAPQPTAQAATPGAGLKGPLAPEDAKAQCWMKYEGDKKVKNIDARLQLVEKCVDDTLRGQLAAVPQR